MLKGLLRNFGVLNVVQKAEVSKTAVVLVEKGAKAPTWTQTTEAALSDFEKLKSSWVYPSGHYERAYMAQVSKEDVLKKACQSVTALKAKKVSRADVVFPSEFKEREIEIFANTAILKNYEYKQKSKQQEDEEDKEEETELEEINLLHCADIEPRNFEMSMHSARCALYARDLVNTRGSVATPEYIAHQAQHLYSQYSDLISIEVLQGEELKEKGLNLLYSVGKAATSPPHLVVLKYNHPSATSNLSLVGKGVTFDTGGLDIKPASAMDSMYCDKAGACTTLAAFKWAVEMQVPVNLTCALALAENSVSSKAYKPQDIITSLKGLTVEIGHTDAEGRLCLADAMTYVQRNHKPDVMVDLATLTGACVVALGDEMAGIFGNDKKLVEEIIQSGEHYKEAIWHLPITKHHQDNIKGKVADLSNSGKTGYGGASTAAAFLKNFVEKGVKWAHIDIAGPAHSKKSWDQFPMGGTGFGVQTLTKFISEFK